MNSILQHFTEFDIPTVCVGSSKCIRELLEEGLRGTGVVIDEDVYSVMVHYSYSLLSTALETNDSIFARDCYFEAMRCPDLATIYCLTQQGLLV